MLRKRNNDDLIHIKRCEKFDAFKIREMYQATPQNIGFQQLSENPLQLFTAKKNAKSPFMVSYLPSKCINRFSTRILIDFRKDKFAGTYFRYFFSDFRNLVHKRGQTGNLTVCKE